MINNPRGGNLPFETRLGALQRVDQTSGDRNVSSNSQPINSLGQFLNRTP